MNDILVQPKMELSDWNIIKQNIKLQALNIAEMMSVAKSSDFHKEHIKQMQANAQHMQQTLDVLYEALIDMQLEVRALENMQLQIQLGDATIDEVAWFEKREAQD
tara:strand:- start:33 stop:347 length:315 start_codon:yes stop_codon:yes gene_type:complete